MAAPPRMFRAVPSGATSISLAVNAVSGQSLATSSSAVISPHRCSGAANGSETKLSTSGRQPGAGWGRLPTSCRVVNSESPPWLGTGSSGSYR